VAGNKMPQQSPGNRIGRDAFCSADASCVRLSLARKAAATSTGDDDGGIQHHDPKFYGRGGCFVDKHFNDDQQFHDSQFPSAV
jgi:hypothetical protein